MAELGGWKRPATEPDPEAELESWERCTSAHAGLCECLEPDF